CLVSIYPTVSFLNWLKDLQKNQPPQLELGKVKLLQWLIKAELFSFLFIPLFAVIMAKG
ncbi:MAG: DUF2214 family protein, partial [Sphaerospermopsis sp. SIO1G2]|nr:DUF2214 family protein [Sphaerospermopsis sp. SIO1G2]